MALPASTVPRRLAHLGAALALALAAPAQALDLNGFLPGAGRGDLAISYTSEGYDEFWVGDVKVSDPGVGEVETWSATAWLRWGLTDDLAIIVNAPYVDTDSDGLGGFGESDFQDLTALVAWRPVLVDGSIRHSIVVAGGARTPISDYEDNLPVDVGDGSTDVLVRAVYQLEAGAFYFSQQLGWDFRGSDVPDGLPLYTELGLTTGRVTWNLWYSRYIADGGTDIGDPGFTFPSNEDETERVGAKLYARINDGFGVAGGYFTTLDGRNSGDVDGFSASAVFSF